MPSIKKINNCRVCGNNKINKLFDFKKTPLEGDFFRKPIKHKTYPLNLRLCRKCGYVFLSHVVDQKKNYKNNFSDMTDVTVGLKKHLLKNSKHILSKYNIKNNSLCIDIGSSDGSLLYALKKQKMKAVGIDPAIVISKTANKNGLKTFVSFFNKTITNKIIKSYGTAKIIFTSYTFANVDNISDFIKNVKKLLDPNGYFVIETGYHPIQMGKHNMFDYIYHEHFSYFTLNTLVFFFKKFGLEIIEAKITKPKGGSILIVAKFRSKFNTINSSVNKIIKLERNLKVNKVIFYKNFFKKINKIGQHLNRLVISNINSGREIIGFGASHSTTVLLYHFNLGKHLSYLIDDNKLKHGLYSPGFNLPIFEVKELFNNNRIFSKKTIILLAWQHQKTILKKYRNLIGKNITFIAPLPIIKKISN